MKKIYLILISAAIVLASCTGDRERRLKTWIKKAEKPITIRRTSDGVTSTSHQYSYTLIDANSNVYQVNNIDMNLPEILK